MCHISTTNWIFEVDFLDVPTEGTKSHFDELGEPFGIHFGWFCTSSTTIACVEGFLRFLILPVKKRSPGYMPPLPGGGGLFAEAINTRLYGDLVLKRHADA